MQRLVLLLTLSCLLAGKPTSARAAAPTELRFLTYFAETLRDSMRRIVDEFNTTHPGLVVHYEFVPFEDLKRQLLVANASGDLPDVVMIDNPDNAAFAQAGIFVDITDLVARWEGNGRFLAGAWQSTFYQGRQYGIPFTSDCLALFYDRAALQRAGVRVPETWDELRVAARKLTAPGRYGLAISAFRSEEGTFQFLPWLFSAGGDVAHLDSPAGVRAMEYLRSLVVEGSMSAEVIGWTQYDAQKQFSAGKAAMMIDGPWTFGSIERDSPGLDYGIAKVPKDTRFASVLGGENLAITRQAKRDAAWVFVQYLASREIIGRFSSATGYLPPRTDVARPGDQWDRDPRLRVFIDQIQYAIPRGPHPRWPEISNAISRAVQEGLSGSKPPRKALEDAQRDIAALGAPAPAAGRTPRDGR
jgi:multiple sugar transport system substrate-binding protein